jgi:predicted DNA-binding transcriptional regulator AlpA
MAEIDDKGLTGAAPFFNQPTPLIPVKQLNRYKSILRYLAGHSEMAHWIDLLGNNIKFHNKHGLLPKELSEMLGISRSSVYRLIKLKKLMSKQSAPRKRHFISLHAIDVYLEL